MFVLIIGGVWSLSIVFHGYTLLCNLELENDGVHIACKIASTLAHLLFVPVNPVFAYHMIR